MRRARDLARGERIAADAVESGCVFVNDNVKCDVRLPFGGVKESGSGRELPGYGIREFVNIKTVWVAGPAEGAAEKTRAPAAPPFHRA